MKARRISVIVPTRNRRELLLRLLHSLFAQTLPAEEYEIIVASDGSTDGTSEAVARLAEQHPHLRLLERAQGGPGAARNSAAREARGDYLAFTDDDCVASPQWLEILLRRLERSQAVGVEGRTSCNRLEITPLTHQMVNETASHVVPTCNAAYRKDLFLKVGGFDERFPYPHNEDVDLAWRIEEYGKIEFDPEAVVDHPPRREGFSKMANRVRHLESEFWLFEKHPAKYQMYLSRSPWWTIYWRILVVFQLQQQKSCCKYLIRLKPGQFAIGTCLVLARAWKLLRFFPCYFRAYRACARMGLPVGVGLVQQNNAVRPG